eukprot:16760-Amphidinium_carterae.1
MNLGFMDHRYPKFDSLVLDPLFQPDPHPTTDQSLSCSTSEVQERFGASARYGHQQEKHQPPRSIHQQPSHT